jgi:lysophospholipase L1-like esterase
MNWETLLCFGDSITFGARSYLGYPEICGNILEKELDKSWHVINHATNGFTTIDLVRSINTELKNYKEAYPSLITVMIGTNDIKQNVPLNDFKIAYKQLVNKLKLLSINNNILLLNIPPLTQKVFYPYNYEMNENISVFNTCIAEIATENKLRLLHLDFTNDDFFDGVHLNHDGVNSAAKQLAKFILKDKGIESTSDLS